LIKPEQHRQPWHNPIVELDALQLSQAIHARQVSCREVMQAYLAQIERFTPQGNARGSLREPEVLLAEADQPVQAGNAYILPDDIGLAERQRGLYFHGDAQGVQVATLPPAHSAVVLLSGADTAQVAAVLARAAAGAWVGAQGGEGCYDPAAANAAVAAGMDAGEPPQLAQRIVERWGVSE